MKDKFNKKLARDREAAEYFGSDEFVDLLRRTAETIHSQGRYCHGTYGALPDIAPKRQDLPYIERSFQKVKEEFPALNHIRLNRGVAHGIGRYTSIFFACAVGDHLILSEKKNNVFRRMKEGFKPSEALTSMPWGKISYV